MNGKTNISPQRGFGVFLVTSWRLILPREPRSSALISAGVLARYPGIHHWINSRNLRNVYYLCLFQALLLYFYLTILWQSLESVKNLASDYWSIIMEHLHTHSASQLFTGKHSGIVSDSFYNFILSYKNIR